MRYRIAIIGTGELGSRHLQAFRRAGGDMELYAIDPDPNSIRTARERLHSSIAAPLPSVTFSQSLSSLPKHLDVAIIATRSDQRLDALRGLLSNVDVRNIILEKFLFQSIGDYDTCAKLLNERNCSAWVNCPRRTWPYHAALKSAFAPLRDSIEYTVTGGRWNLASNAIHFLDHLAYLTGDWDFELSPDGLDPIASESKHANCIEFTGTLLGSSSRGSQISLTNTTEPGLPLEVRILSGDVECRINETTRKAELRRGEGRETTTFHIPLQSETTHLLVEKLLYSDKCPLTPYMESAELHKSILRAFANHPILAGRGKACPIT